MFLHNESFDHLIATNIFPCPHSLSQLSNKNHRTMKLSRRNNLTFLLALIVAPPSMALPAQPKLHASNMDVNTGTLMNATLSHTNFTLVIETPKKPSHPFNVTLPFESTNSNKTVLLPVQTEGAKVIEKEKGTVSSAATTTSVKEWLAWWRMNMEIEGRQKLRYKWKFRGRPPL